MEPDPYDGTRAAFYERHLFKANERIELRLMRLPEYDLTEYPVWAAKGKRGTWYPFFREPIDRPDE